MAKRRKPLVRRKPRLSLTLSPEVYDRLRRVQAAIPGASLSGVVNELLDAALPMMEEMARAVLDTRLDDGSFDDARVKDAIALWAGRQMIAFGDDPVSDTDGQSTEGDEAG